MYLCPALLLLSFTAWPAIQSVGISNGLKDYTNTPLSEWKITATKPKVDPKTGFVIAGKNHTALLRTLPEIHGRSVADLEKAMRPGADSQKGFLGKDEKLLDVLAADNDFVLGKHGLTHQELARHLQILGAIAVRNLPKPGQPEWYVFQYHGVKFRSKAACYRGYQNSPFGDDAKANCDAVIENLDNGTKLGFSLLVPLLIERYGFYEGKGTPYRVDPAEVLALLPFLKKNQNP